MLDRVERAKQNLEKEPRGAALVVALIVMTMLSLLTISSLEMLTLNIQIVNNHIHDLQALYIADAGVERAISELRVNPNWDTGFNDVEFPGGSGNTYTVVIVNSYPSDRSALITSTGAISSFQRGLEVKVKITGSSSPHSVTTEYWKEISVP